MGNPDSRERRGLSRYRSAVGVSGLAAAVYWAIDNQHDGPALLAAVPHETRETLFASLAATSGSLLGFAIAAVTILLSVGQGERMNWLFEQSLFQREARALFISTILVLGGSTLIFLALVVVGTHEDGLALVWGLVFAATIGLVLERLVRLISFLNGLMRIALKDASGKPLRNPPMRD